MDMRSSLFSLLRGFSNDQYQPADKLFPTDRFLAATVLRLIPKKVTANQITLLRFILTPLVIVALAMDYLKIGFALFLLTAFTDAIDGAIARTKNQITNWGKLFDPLADKFLIGSVVFVVVIEHLDFWLGVVILVIEAATIFLSIWKRAKGRVLQANNWGKTKMVLEVVGAALLILGLFTGWPALFPFSKTIFYLAVLFALVSLGSYGI